MIIIIIILEPILITLKCSNAASASAKRGGRRVCEEEGGGGGRGGVYSAIRSLLHKIGPPIFFLSVFILSKATSVEFIFIFSVRLFGEVTVLGYEPYEAHYLSVCCVLRAHV